MTDIIITRPFDYTALAPAIADDLRDRAARVRELMTKPTIDLIAISCELLPTRLKLNYNQFIDWVECEIGISARNAQNCMEMAPRPIVGGAR